ncbi:MULTISPECIES: aspartate aminotransferase family protein [unclassified Streptomyces]|uniref:Aspartate aminotransferase family protein n=1 Tax=Streptomyces evansiae TaxID=3075535 RepID=A0ABU2QZT1_9ACTN|nr:MULTISPECIES: aspartate aminotransferase family protein [unclassified Streptomyces]EFK98335.1 glutamate-1-semialdehyde-2,1-aminomutase [Streptomyces sp. SPB78]MDT0408689.1 aspartate aminotransferase family protein [Streptomyces sp. DSM 41979]MYQ58480.1 aminotransferase class III-fold pyridoxal phosphate-dependent enzyme [Streptomyces sp. SID4926]MYR27524.1 aminotransferase class III-fold pyridoxal phosphate-dependent enzyme [Streptomyces sp. SID4945]SCE09157.1 glutamate-1-semialdehyde 2,1-a
MTLAERARRVIPGGVNSGQRSIPGFTDLVIARTRGSRFWDQHGREFTDYHAAFGPAVLGHNDPDVAAATAEAGTTLALAGVGVTEAEVALAEELTALVPSLEKVLLTSTGSEATFHALRVARAATGRDLVVKFQGCYHGWHDAVSLNVISAPERVGTKDPTSTGILAPVLDATLVLPFNDPEAVRRVFAEHGRDIAAVILEPVPHNVGALLPTDTFLRTLREECTKAGTVLVFDEVITGFRHGLGGYQEICGITPDLTTLGKAIANGAPIGALGGRADLMDLFSTRPGGPAFFAGTYNGHPQVVAAALATLRKLREEPVHEHIYRLGARARDGLAALYRELDVPAVVTGFGSVFVTYFMDGPAPLTYDDLLANDAARFIGVRRALTDHGIFELPLNLKRSHVSYAHTDDDIDRLLEATAKAVRTVLAEGTPTDLAHTSTMGGAQR